MSGCSALAQIAKAKELAREWKPEKEWPYPAVSRLVTACTERTMDPAATDGELDIRLAIKERKRSGFCIGR